MKRLDKKIAIVTGAARGIGKAIAQHFSNEGAFVFVTDINDIHGRVVAKALKGNGVYHHLDISVENDWLQLTDFVIEQYDKIDILVNNIGGIGFGHQALTQPLSSNEDFTQWQNICNRQLNSVFLGCRSAQHMMHNTDHGSIINIPSQDNLFYRTDLAAFGSTKAAIVHYTKTLASHYAEKTNPIRCNAINPGAIFLPKRDLTLGDEATQRKQASQRYAQHIPLKTFGDPSDIAYAAIYLGSNESKHITGTELIVDGGLSTRLASPSHYQPKE